MVRKLVVNLIRFLNATGEPRAALNVADATLVHWDDGEASDSRLTIRMAKADALFAYGKHADAFQLRQEVRAAMRSDLDRWAAEIIQLDGTLGARSRIVGKFSEALAADRESVRAHVAKFGNDDPRTFTAMDSLVTDLTLAGSVTEATRTASGVYRDCLAFYSDAGHPAALAARNVLGRCRWLAGHYGEATSSIGEAHAGYQALASRGILDANHPWRLLHEIDFAVARRDKGLPPAQLRALAEDMADIRRRCWRTLSADHPQTLAAMVVLGSLLRRSSGRAAEAGRILKDAERHYHSALPGHPYGHACTAYLAVVRCQAANGGLSRIASRLIPVIQDATDRLTDSVGEVHPLSLMAAVALTNTLARAGELEAALKCGQETLAGFRALLGVDHPHALAAEANTITIQSRLGHAPVPEDLRARYAAELDQEHPDLVVFTQGELIDVDFTPIPL